MPVTTNNLPGLSGGAASETQVVNDIVNALTAINTLLPQIVTTLAEVGGYFFQDFAGIHSDPALMTAAAQAILTLAGQQTGTAAQIASDVASGFAAAINYYLQNVGTLIDYVVGTAASVAGLTDTAGLPLAADVLADLIADTTTAARPLSPSHAVNFITAGNDSAVSLLLAIAGKINDAQFADEAGAAIADGIRFVTFTSNFPMTLASAVQAGTLSNGQAALILGSVIFSAPESHLGPQGVSDFSHRSGDLRQRATAHGRGVRRGGHRRLQLGRRRTSAGAYRWGGAGTPEPGRE